jgi:Arc/MetJ family transcription regulator
MRTTINLDDDVFAAALQRAERDRLTLGEAVSRGLRDGLRAGTQQANAPVAMRSRYSVLPARGESIASAHVRRLMEQEGIQRHANG